MVHRHQREIIVVINFPEFCRDANVIIAVIWNELVSSDFVPLTGGDDLCRSEGVDAQADRRSPWHRVFNEFHRLSVPRIKKWTRCFQSLLGHDFLIGFDFKLRAYSAV